MADPFGEIVILGETMELGSEVLRSSGLDMACIGGWFVGFEFDIIVIVHNYNLKITK